MAVDVVTFRASPRLAGDYGLRPPLSSYLTWAKLVTVLVNILLSGEVLFDMVDPICPVRFCQVMFAPDILVSKKLSRLLASAGAFLGP